MEKISKQSLRKAMLKQRNEQPTQDCHDLSLQIQKILLAESVWKKANNIAVYMPIQGEVQTQLLCTDAWEHSKKIYAPKCSKTEQGQMSFIACQGLHDFSQGMYGILEPRSELKAEEQNKFDILLVPGLAFTRKGYRLGFGGGYYDRFFSKNLANKTLYLALAFSWQIVENLPVQAWDHPVHAIVTNEGIIWV